MILLGLDLVWVIDLGDPCGEKNGEEREPAGVILWQGERPATIATQFRGTSMFWSPRELNSTDYPCVLESRSLISMSLSPTEPEDSWVL